MTGARPGRAYRRRTARPVVLLVAVLLVAVIATWAVVFSATSGESTTAACAPPVAVPPGVPPFGLAQDSGALDQVTPSPPGAVRIRVFNGGGQRGQANLVASQLGELGFTEVADPGNDPYFPGGDLACRGDIRYGRSGEAAARTVSLVLPCLGLVADGRADDTVDVAIGSTFGEVNPNKPARDALDQLGGPAGQTDTGGSSVDPTLLTRAREVPC